VNPRAVAKRAAAAIESGRAGHHGAARGRLAYVAVAERQVVNVDDVDVGWALRC
jgi:hypothetical protein